MTIHFVPPAQPVIDYSRAWAKIRATPTKQCTGCRRVLALGDPDVCERCDAHAPTCTHTEITREHLDTCCADGVDCDQCGQPIEQLTGRDLASGELPVCRDCGLDRLYALEA